MSLLNELRRRHVIKVGGAYVVIAWLVVQAASIAFPAFDAPPWVLRVFILILMLGFPIALVMAWAFQATPEGLKLEPPIGNKRVALVASALVVLALAWYYVGQPAVRESIEASRNSAAPAARTATAARMAQRTDYRLGLLLAAISSIVGVLLSGEYSSLPYIAMMVALTFASVLTVTYLAVESHRRKPTVPEAVQ